MSRENGVGAFGEGGQIGRLLKRFMLALRPTENGGYLSCLSFANVGQYFAVKGEFISTTAERGFIYGLPRKASTSFNLA